MKQKILIFSKYLFMKGVMWIRVIIAITPNFPLHYSDWPKWIRLLISRHSFSTEGGHFSVSQRLQTTAANSNAG